MRTSLRNTDEAAHVWAAQTQEHGKAGNVFFEGPTLYSYGRHFAVATIYKHEDGGNVALFNSRRYSNSTAKHQSAARSAWAGNGHALRCSPELWPAGDTITAAQLETMAARQAELDAAAGEALKAAKREQARRARERAKLAKMDAAERLARWTAGENIPLDYAAPLALRYIDDGKRIETSRRAVVPTACALLAWRAYNAGTLAPGDRIGPYTITRTDAETVVIGCHTFPTATLAAFFTA
jgi:hypothetical protein